MTNGVNEWSRAYWLAFKADPRYTLAEQGRARAHDFPKARVRPVEVEEVDVGRTLLLERRFHENVQ